MGSKYIVISLVIFFLALQIVKADWLSGWLYRIPINITEKSGSTLTNYQVLITLDSATLISQGKLKNDCGDIRFTDSDGTTLLNYWIESGCNSANTRIWVNVTNIPANSNKTIYIYYGNPSATSLSNPDLVFDFYDDFNSGTIDSNKWVISAGTSNDVIAVVNGELRSYQDGTSPAKTIQTKNPITLTNFIVEYKAKTVSIGSGHNLGLGIMDSNQADGNGFWPFFSSGNVFNLYKRTPGTWTFLQGSVGSYTLNTYNNYKIVVVGSSFSFYKDNVQVGSTQTVTLGSNKYLILPRIWNENIGDTGDQYYDDIRVRKYVSPEPSITLGNEEISVQITIYAPLNQTYYTKYINVNVSAYSEFNFTLSIYLNNNLIYQNSSLAKNYLNYFTTLNFDNTTFPNTFNLTVYSNNTNRNTLTKTIIFTIKDFDNVTITMFASYNFNGTNQIVEATPFTLKFQINNLNKDLITDLQTNGTINKYYENYYEVNYISSIINETGQTYYPTNHTFLLTLKNGNATWNYTINYTYFNYNLNIYNCSTSNTLKINVLDEETRQPLTLNYSYVRLTYWADSNDKVTKSFENALSFCVFPSFTNYYNVFIENSFAKKDNYALSEYYATNPIILSNTTKEITYMMLSNQYAVPIKFHLPDENYIISIERRYDNNFIFVRNSKSDFSKTALIYLRPYDVFYRFNVYYPAPSGNICFLASEIKVSQQDYYISTCNQAQANITISPIYEENVIINCNFNNNTRLLSCDFDSKDKLNHNITLKVYKSVKPIGFKLYCLNNTYAVSGSVSCLINDNGFYEVNVEANSQYQYLRFPLNLQQLITDINVLYFALILVLICTSAGFYHPFLGLALNILLAFIFNLIGIMNFYTGGIVSLGILFAIILMLWRR